MASPRRRTVAGSERAPLAGARAIGAVARDERFEVTVRIRRRTPIAKLAEGGLHDEHLPAARRYVTREEYAQRYAADPDDIAKVEAFAREHGLVVVESSAPRRSVFLSGTAAQFEAAFGTRIEHYECHGRTYRGRSGPLTVPEELADIVEGVFGIDDRPAAVPHFQRRPVAGESAIRAAAVGASYTPPQLAKLYGFPGDADGSGQCIAIIELGGGYRAADLRAYFRELGLEPPRVSAVRVDHAANHPTNAGSADGEVMLDIEVAAGVAPKAHIAVYFAPNTDKGFLDAITYAIHDAESRPSVVSISWGAAEKDWTEQSMKSFDQAFQTAAALGVTICCAAGDAGSGDQNPDQLAALGSEADGLAHADFPGSSPFVLCCGGTRLSVHGAKISAETVWNDDPQRSATGGGVSDVFPLPAYQRAAGVPPSANPGKHRGRGVPDVAGDADPSTGYRVRVDGEETVIGGTSAVAPLWAGLIALCNQKLGAPAGFVHPLLYGAHGGKAVFRDITQGGNGAYRAKAGWDACTGWGSPDGAKLLRLLAAGGNAAHAHTEGEATGG
ncbi:MAG TPA: S53 family peptidase [Usitatibacter sp.]|nr:S53 family peptidase [Usitatibacter sp.]